MIHSRNAWDDTFRVLDDEGVPARTIFHCFTGGPDEARAALDRDCYLSFSGIVSFKTADDVRAAAALAPADRVLVETDSPYLAPVPHRGKPNEPAFVSLVGAALAAARGVDVERDRRADPRERGAGVRRRAVTPSEIQALLEQHGLRPSKALGQNFLADTNMAEHIVRLAGVQPGDHVVEVGPGLGSLTLALCDAGAHVRAVELDHRLADVLSRRSSRASRSTIVQRRRARRSTGPSCSPTTTAGSWCRTCRTTSRHRWSCARSRPRR